jgi:hypothetical protein
MKLWSFCLLTTLALLYTGLTVGETVTYRRWEKAVYDQKDIQAKMTYFQNMGRVLDSLMHRMAFDSLHDPALAQMLKDHKVKVVVNGAPSPSAAPGTEATTNLAPLSNPVPLTPDASTPSPASAPQAHP